MPRCDGVERPGVGISPSVYPPSSLPSPSNQGGRLTIGRVTLRVTVSARMLWCNGAMRAAQGAHSLNHRTATGRGPYAGYLRGNRRWQGVSWSGVRDGMVSWCCSRLLPPKKEAAGWRPHMLKSLRSIALRPQICGTSHTFRRF